jgi:DNA-binding NtrC family response regulator
VRIDLPPLRQRGDDLGLLAETFAERFSREMDRPVVGITPEAYQVLRQYHWPGNVRELQNVIRRGIVLSQDDMIDVEDLPESLFAAVAPAGGSEAPGFFQARQEQLQRFEREYLTTLLKKHQGNVKAAAEEAQLPRGTLYRLMKNHGLDGADFR